MNTQHKQGLEQPTTIGRDLQETIDACATTGIAYEYSTVSTEADSDAKTKSFSALYAGQLATEIALNHDSQRRTQGIPDGVSLDSDPRDVIDGYHSVRRPY